MQVVFALLTKNDLSDCDRKLQREVVLISHGPFNSKLIPVHLWKNEMEMWFYEDFVELNTGV